MYHREPVDAFLEKLAQRGIEATSASQSARVMAEALRLLWPTSPLVVAWITEDEALPVVLDREGTMQSGWAAALQPALTSAALADRRIARIDLSTAGLPDGKLSVTGLVQRESSYGLVGTASTQPTDGSLQPQAEDSLLKMAAASLTAYLVQARESAELQFRAFLGDLAPPLAHECNNFLNVVLLQVAVLEMDIPGAFARQLEEIRRQGTRFQKLVEQFQAYRNTRPAMLTQVRLEELVAGAGSGMKVAAHGPLPPVLASAADVQHLLSFLASHAARVGTEQATLAIEAIADKVLLSLACPSAHAEADSLDWCACQSLARRLHGKSYGRRRADGGTDYVIELKSADETRAS